MLAAGRNFMIQIAIPINADSAPQAENLCSWIRELNNHKPKGHAIVAFDSSVSHEMRERVKITAGLAFETVEEVLVPSKDSAEKMSSAIAKRNASFMAIAEFCQRCVRVPWLLLEPDCVPTNPEWLDKIEAFYDSQPKRYVGVHLKSKPDSEEKFLHRVSVYHMGAFMDVVKTVDAAPEVPFEISCGQHFVPRSSKFRMIQPLKIQDELDFAKIWPEAQIVCGDVTGALIEKFRADGVHIGAQKIIEREVSEFTVPINHPAPPSTLPPPRPPGRVDLRTKAGRAILAAKKGEYVKVQDLD